VTEIDERTPDTDEPAIGQPRQPEAQPESPHVAALRKDAENAGPKHHSARQVAVHGGAMGGLGTFATIAPAAPGPAACAAAGVAGLVAAGTVAYRNRGKSGRRTRTGGLLRRTTRTSGGRTRQATTRTISRRGTGAGRAAGATRGRRTGAFRKAHGGATGTLGKRTPRTAGVAPARRTPGSARRTAGRSAAAPGRAAMTRRRGLGRTANGAGRTGIARHGKAHGGLTPASSRASRKQKRTAAPPQPATPTTKPRAASRAKAAKARPARPAAPAATGRPKPPAMKAAPKAPAPKHKKARTPKNTAPKNAPRKAAPATAPKTADSTPADNTQAATKTTPAVSAKPSRPVTAPGQTPKASPTMAATTSGIDAVTESAAEHIGGFQPENALQILDFLAGLTRFYQELGVHLASVSERLADEEPVERMVTEHMRELAGHTATLSDWASETGRIFEQAHATELSRLRDPRRNEHHWDVQSNN